jgi:hypothetical protein
MTPAQSEIGKSLGVEQGDGAFDNGEIGSLGYPIL